MSRRLRCLRFLNGHCAVHPPSMGSAAPVIDDAAEPVQRNTASAPISSVVTNLRVGWACSSTSRMTCSSVSIRALAVSGISHVGGGTSLPGPANRRAKLGNGRPPAIFDLLLARTPLRHGPGTATSGLSPPWHRRPRRPIQDGVRSDCFDNFERRREIAGDHPVQTRRAACYAARHGFD